MEKIYLPGETLTVHIAQKGSKPDQGIGYLNDGTMIIVQGGRPYLNTSMEVEITKVLQTSTQHMIFARLRTNLS